MKIISTLGNTKRIEFKGFEFLITDKSGYGLSKNYSLTFRKAPADFLEKTNKEIKGIRYVSLNEINAAAESIINKYLPA